MDRGNLRPRMTKRLAQYMLTDAHASREQFTALLGVLRQEYAALDRLSFKLTEAELLAQAHEGRFLAMIADEVDEIADEVGTIAIARAMIVAEVCDALGQLDDDISLNELMASAPRDIVASLTELRTQLLELTNEISATTIRGSGAAKEQLATIKAALDNLEPVSSARTGYDQWGAQQTATTGATRFDEAF